MKKAIDKRKSLWYNKQVVKSDAGMAQSVEHVIGNDEVISSILITSSKSHAKAWDFSFIIKKQKADYACNQPFAFSYLQDAYRRCR